MFKLYLKKFKFQRFPITIITGWRRSVLKFFWIWLIDDIAFKKKINAFWSVGALKRDNQFVIFTTWSFFLWDFLLSYPPSNTIMHCEKLKCDIVYSNMKLLCIHFIIKLLTQTNICRLIIIFSNFMIKKFLRIWLVHSHAISHP